MYTYLDVDEIEGGKMFAVPMPSHKPLPDEWRARSNIIDTTGTLVLWKNFDDHRLSWRGAKATLKHTELLIGRMYRKFIDNGQLCIRLLALREEEPAFDKRVRVNDPLYLMRDSSTPEPFDKEPMFQSWGEEDAVEQINYGGAKHNVVVRMSWAHEKTIPESGTDRGNKPYGKHAAKNIGLSIVREGRELDLDPSWTNSYDPTERWWGIEVEFPSALDEIFGVTNNKQNATVFSGMAQFEWRAEAEAGESLSDFCERIESEGDPRALLVPIVNHIRQQIQQVRKRLKHQTAGRRTKQEERHDAPGAEDLATKKFEERAEQGHSTDTDSAELTEEDRKSLKGDLIKDKLYSEKVAEKIANATLTRNRKVVFLTKAMDGYAFFNVEKQGLPIKIVFNTNHPLYEQLIEVLESDTGDESDADLLDRIHKAADTLKLVFSAWARYEMEEVEQQNRLFDVRQEWGRMARVFLTEQEDD